MIMANMSGCERPMRAGLRSCRLNVLRWRLWIEAIPDSLTRRIFRMYYVDGMNQSRIAKRVHLSQSQVSRKIDGFLKDA